MKDIYYLTDLEIHKIVSKQEFKKNLYNFNLPFEFNLLNLSLIPDSLFQFCQKEGEEVCISGINIPWIYYGMLYSTFCWHIEDLNLFSVNYLLEGKPKVWYSISSEDKENFENYVKSKFYSSFIHDKKFLFSLKIQIDPKELIENGIQVYRTIQNPGEIIVTSPKGYHMGFSLGNNIGEAVNFGVSINDN